MTGAVPLAEVWRGDFLECVHSGHAVICDAGGQIVQAWGDPTAVILPRSSAKMIQALPLLESGAAAAFGLSQRQLALACASHIGAAIHTDAVAEWLKMLELEDEDFRCGPQMPDDIDARDGLIRAGDAPCQMHNNCSGKHSGFLTLNKHLKAGPDYIDPDHPVQQACLAAFEEVTGETSPGFGIDGCSAPNFACSLHGMARAMAFFANAKGDDTRQTAARTLWQAMIAHPEMVAGEGKACTQLMRACSEPVAIKTGAEGYYIAILPNRGLGVALKVEDGATRGSECAIATLLVYLGVLEAENPVAQAYMNAPILNRRDLNVGRIVSAEGFA